MILSGIGLSGSSAAGMLSDPARFRLVHYCRRVGTGPADWVERPCGNPFGRERTRRVPYSDPEFRRLVWADGEVRDVLVDDDNFEVLADELGGFASPINLLQLMCDMTLEAERAGVAA